MVIIVLYMGNGASKYIESDEGINVDFEEYLSSLSRKGSGISQNHLFEQRHKLPAINSLRRRATSISDSQRSYSLRTSVSNLSPKKNRYGLGDGVE